MKPALRDEPLQHREGSASTLSLEPHQAVRAGVLLLEPREGEGSHGDFA